MKAAMLWAPERLEIVELPLRELASDEVLLRVEACSICGSDLEGYHGLHPKVVLPQVMGHEVASTVVAIGSGVTRLSVGDRVAGTGSVSCGECTPCRAGRRHECLSPRSPGFDAPGAYADYFVSRAEGLTLIPEGVSFVEAAVAQPVGIANHAVATRAAVQPGELVLIQGCGPIGLAAMMLSKLRGAHVVSTDIVDYRGAVAREWGADFVLNPQREDVREAIRELSHGRGADKVIECVGGDQDETIPEAVACVKRGGLVTIVGSFAQDRATLPVVDFKFNEKALIGSQSMPEGYEPVFDLIPAGKLDLRRLVTHTLPLAELEHGLSLMDKKAENVLKVVIQPSL